MGACLLAADQTPNLHRFERQELVVNDFQASGYVLDIGGGGEGIIGRMKPQQVVAIDLFARELLESPPGPLKIVMDATDLKFLDASFDTATAFFSLMYMKPEIQKKVFTEVYRVLKPGGRWLIWDAVVPTALEKETRGVVFYFRFKLPKETVETGYGTPWPDRPLDLPYYQGLAKQAGFHVTSAKQEGAVFQTFSLELSKPAAP
jgi:ubiquinone/menaquinone biosynthesis C-methylase UbiE